MCNFLSLYLFILYDFILAFVIYFARYALYASLYMVEYIRFFFNLGDCQTSKLG